MYDLNSNWDIWIQFILGEAQHHLRIEQEHEKLSGIYHSQYSTQPLQGSAKGNAVHLQATIHHEGQSVRYLLDGVIRGDEMHGTLDLGEYWQATWKAQKRACL